MTNDRDAGPRIAIGCLVSPTGYNSSWDRRGERDVIGDLSLADTQKNGIEVRLAHHPNAPVGRLRYLERQRSGSVWAVASIPSGGMVDFTDLSKLYFSIGGSGTLRDRNCDPLLALGPTTDFRLDEVGLVTKTDMIGTEPLRIAYWDFDTHGGGGWPISWPGWLKNLMDRALAARSRLRRSAVMEIVNAPDVPPPALDAVEQLAAAAELDMIGAEIGDGTLTRSARRPAAHFRANIGRITRVGGEPVR